MKILNAPIDMIAIFNSNGGEITPFKFRYNDMAIKVQKIYKIYEEKFAGNRRIVFVCIHNGKDIYEIKYEVDSLKWYLFKK